MIKNRHIILRKKVVWYYCSQDGSKFITPYIKMLSLHSSNFKSCLFISIPPFYLHLQEFIQLLNQLTNLSMKIIHKKTETYHYFQDQVQKNDQVAEQTIDLRNKQDFFEAILDDSNYILQKLPTEVSVQSEQDLLSHPEALSHYKLNNQNTLSLCVIGSLQKLYEMDSKNLQMITEKQFNATKSFGDVIRKRGRRCNKTMKLGKRRCTCKKTQCQKKYCDCFRQGLRCGIDCQCLNCLNIKHDHVLEMDGSCERYLSLC